MSRPRPITMHPFGFSWGPMGVTRLAEVRGTVVLEVRGASTRVAIYVSPKGRSVRVFIDGKEVTP